MGTTADKLNLLLNSKADIKAALVEKGQEVSDVFSEYGDKIRAIQTGVELPELSNPASASEIGEGYDAINGSGERVVGTGELAVNLAPELATQDDLISQIMTALEGKSAASGATIDTCTVRIMCYTKYYFAMVYRDGAFSLVESTTQTMSYPIDITDVVCGSIFVIKSDSEALNTSEDTLLSVTEDASNTGLFTNTMKIAAAPGATTTIS